MSGCYPRRLDEQVMMRVLFVIMCVLFMSSLVLGVFFVNVPLNTPQERAVVIDHFEGLVRVHHHHTLNVPRMQ